MLIKHKLKSQKLCQTYKENVKRLLQRLYSRIPYIQTFLSVYIIQAAEKELSRQLQREKDKNRNLEQKIRDVRNENEKLRLQVPFDEASLSSEKYDIPYSTHSSQRHESVKVGLYNEYTVETV